MYYIWRVKHLSQRSTTLIQTGSNSQSLPKMMSAEKNRTAIIQVMNEPGNNTCADCGARNPDWASSTMGLFICISCSGIHRNLGTHISVVKSLRLDTWTDSKLQFMADNGNIKGNEVWSYSVPLCYRRPKSTDPLVLREQWIRSKYERKEFIYGAPQPSYLSGSKRGYLRKKGKDDNNWNVRLFVLSEEENALKYYIKDQDTRPKDVLKLTDLNAVFVGSEKTGKENSLQLTIVNEGTTRNYFVYSEAGQEIVDWYMSIRSAKLNLLGLNTPNTDPEKISHLLTRDFTRDGYLFKTGPRDGESWNKRWFTLDGRRLLYSHKPIDASPLGEICLGTKAEGYSIEEGLSGKHKTRPNTFTLTTPERVFNLSTETENEMILWMEDLQRVLSAPMTDDEKKAMKETENYYRGKKHHSLKRHRYSAYND